MLWAEIEAKENIFRVKYSIFLSSLFFYFYGRENEEILILFCTKPRKKKERRFLFFLNNLPSSFLLRNLLRECRKFVLFIQYYWEHLQVSHIFWILIRFSKKKRKSISSSKKFPWDLLLFFFTLKKLRCKLDLLILRFETVHFSMEISHATMWMFLIEIFFEMFALVLAFKLNFWSHKTSWILILWKMS